LALNMALALAVAAVARQKAVGLVAASSLDREDSLAVVVDDAVATLEAEMEERMQHLMVDQKQGQGWPSIATTTTTIRSDERSQRRWW
jgi:ABC-type antimicrobial peptide transport system ATPase subunit